MEPSSPPIRSSEPQTLSAPVQSGAKRPRVEGGLGLEGGPGLQAMVLAVNGEAGADPGASLSVPPQTLPAPPPAQPAAPPTKTVLSHVATEQRRRDRINEGFAALRELIPHKDKMDKATFLQQAVEYIQQLQTVIRQLLDMGAVSSLPEESQWAIRMLVPRKAPDATAPGGSTPPAAGPAPGSLVGLAPPSAYLPYLLQPQQLALLSKHTQQLVAEQPSAAGEEVAAVAPPAPPASLPLPPAPVSQPPVSPGAIDLGQLQALLQQQQQQQAAQQLQAARGLWHDPHTLWQVAQLQQLMQTAQSQALSTTGLSLPPLTQDALTTLAQQQQHALSVLMSPAPSVPGTTSAQALPPLVPPSSCAAGSPDSSEPGAAEKGQLAKARKTTKVRRGGTAAKIAKPELALDTAPPVAGRPELHAE